MTFNQFSHLLQKLINILFYPFITGIFVPSLTETVYLWPNNLGFCKWKLIKNIILCILSILALITGAAVSIIEIINMNNDLPEASAQCKAV